MIKIKITSGIGVNAHEGLLHKLHQLPALFNDSFEILQKQRRKRTGIGLFSNQQAACHKYFFRGELSCLWNSNSKFKKALDNFCNAGKVLVVCRCCSKFKWS